MTPLVVKLPFSIKTWVLLLVFNRGSGETFLTETEEIADPGPMIEFDRYSIACAPCPASCPSLINPRIVA
jgi:hypothetical protein